MRKARISPSPSMLLPLVLLGSIALMSACGEPSVTAPTRPLLDESMPPDILVESQSLDHSPTATANRLLRGWRFLEPFEDLKVAPAAGTARLEIVNLEPRSRGLRLATTGPVHGQARLVGTETLPLEADGDLEIVLPAALPTGRVAIDLEWSGETALELRRSRLGGSLPAGVVQLEEEAILQSGWSAIDFVRQAKNAKTLVGRFEPPKNAGEEQSFEIHLVGDTSGSQQVFHWRSTPLARWRDARSFEVPVSAEDSFFRVRLLARGAGPQGRWSQLGWVDEEAPPEPQVEVPPAPPVVVLYVLDALRADTLGHLGGPDRASQALDRLAGEGVALLSHQSVAPNTTPSTKSLFTGQYFPWMGQKKLTEDGPETLAELFTRAGYRTGVFTGNGNLSRQAGNIRGFEAFARRLPGQSRIASYNDDSEKVHAAALDWIGSLEKSEPVFLYLHVVHPHAPYIPPQPFLQDFTEGHEDSSVIGSKDTLKRYEREGTHLASDADRRRMRALYEAGLAYSDTHLANFLEALKSRYDEREILLLVTSDHGEELFDHEGVLHGSTLYQEQLRVPLIVHWPERLAARRVSTLTDTIDLHETLRQMLGEEPAPHLGEGHSLWPLLLSSRDTHKDVSFAFKAGPKKFIFAVRSERYKLIWAPRDGQGPGMGKADARTYDLEYLFDLKNDPGEMENLAGEPILEADWLRARLHGWLNRAADLETGEEITGLDEETLAILKALGYVD